MKTFPDFVAWAGSQVRAATLLELDGSTLSLILKGTRALLPAHVIRAERASNGLFRCEDMLPGTEFVRGAQGIRWLEGIPAPKEKQAAA